MALIGIPENKPVRWLNPDHISSLIPRPKQRVDGIQLDVVVKILGIPEEYVTIGVFDDQAAMNAAWDQLLAYLAAHTHDPARDSGVR